MAEMGRPTVMDEITLQKLEAAFSDDATDLQACFLASISSSTLYNYQKENPDFLERKWALKEMTAFQAKKNIKNKVLEGDVDTSKWVVERKEKGEYSLRNEHTGKDGKDLPTPIIPYVPANSSHPQDSGNA